MSNRAEGTAQVTLTLDAIRLLNHAIEVYKNSVEYASIDLGPHPGEVIGGLNRLLAMLRRAESEAASCAACGSTYHECVDLGEGRCCDGCAHGRGVR